MIITNKFVWGHIPKTAGDATCAFFMNCIPDKVLFVDPDDYNKHTPFSERKELINNKKLVLNIRRLPNFLLSFIHHHIFYYNLFTNKNLPLLDRTAYFDKNYVCHKEYLPPPHLTQAPDILATLGDWMIDYYVGCFNIDYWLRCEYILDDCSRFINKFYYKIYNNNHKNRIKKINKLETKVPLNNYNKDPLAHFTEEEIKIIYENNPKWTAIEKSVYGNLLV